MKNRVKAEGSLSAKKAKVISDPFIFNWAINAGGHEWATGVEDGEPRLIPRRAGGQGYTESFSLVETFVEFANLEATPESIQGFADRCGDIYSNHALSEYAVSGDNTGRGSSLRHWQTQIGDMRVLFDLWKAIERRNLKRLKQVIKWETKAGHTFVQYSIDTPARKARSILTHTAHESWGSKNFREGDIVLPARCALQRELNFRLEQHPTVPRLNWTPDSIETTGGFHQRIIFRPPHLLAAMWLSFAQSVTEDFQFRRCTCGKYFQVGPGSGKRTDSQYHDDICRVKAWQERKSKEEAAKR